MVVAESRTVCGRPGTRPAVPARRRPRRSGGTRARRASRRAPARPRDARHRDRELRAGRGERPAAIASAHSAETAPCCSRSSVGHAEHPLLDLVRVGDDATHDDVRAARDSVSRAATSPAVHDSAVATVAPRARAASSTSSSSGRSSSLNTSAPRRSLIASTSRRRASRRAARAPARASRPPKRRAQIVVVVPASSPPASSNAWATTDSLIPKTRSRLPLEPLAGAQRGGRGMLLDHRPHLRELGGRPGKDDDRRVLPRASRPGAVPTGKMMSRLAARAPACRCRGRTPPGGIPRRRAYSARSGDPRAQGLVDPELAPAHAGDGRDRAIVVRRPEPARGDDDGVLAQLAQAVVDLLLAVAHGQHALELEPEAIERLGEEARVAVRDEPEQQLAPRDQDRGCRPRTAVNSRWGCQPGRGSRRRPLP